MQEHLAKLLEAIDDYLLAAGTAARDRKVDRTAAKIKKTFKKFFGRQKARVVNDFLPELRHLYDVKVAEALRPLIEATKKPPTEVTNVLQRAFSFDDQSTIDESEAAVGDILLAGAKATMKSLGVITGPSFNLENPRAVDYMQNYGAKLVKGIDATTRDQLSTILTDGIENGKSYSKVAGEIKTAFDGFGTARATTIAITEAATAYVQGNLMSAAMLQDAGLNMEKAWLALGDPCDECEDNADEGYIDIDDNFSSGDDGPPAHPNCRCDLAIRRVGAKSAGDE